MREFVRYIIISITAIFTVGMTSCYDDTFDFDGANEISLKVNATTCFSGVDARSILDETKPVAISNYCLLIFDKKATDGKLFLAKDLGSSLSSSVVTFPLTTDFYNGQAYYAVLFGNVTLSQLGLTEGTSTVSTLFSKMATVSAGDNKFTDASKFTWSAFKEISISSANLNFTLNPNVAKVKVTIRNNSANSERTQLLSVQVKNVANKVRYAQNALSDAGLFTVADNKAAFSAGTVSNINYNSESINLAPGGSPISFTWYIPHNELNQKQSSGSRAERADANATYIEIKGVRGADFMDNLYKIYLGKNETNTSYDNFSNYHVSADTQYNLNIIINDDGLTYSGNNNVSDKGGATQALGVVKLPAGSNCYMIHPKGTATAGGTIYELPLDQINRYWRDVVGDANRTLSSTTKWRPVHIWQDMDKQAICFCDENGNDITKYVSPEYTTDLFTGNKPIRFKIKNNDAYGNVIIGVLFDGVSGFLWSWHLWITDYNPDAAYDRSWLVNQSSFNTNLNEYKISNLGNGMIDRDPHPYKVSSKGNMESSVHHYGHLRSAYSNVNTVWNADGLYENCWIMDRNLGAITPNNFDAEDPYDAYGLYYQYGRKDPIPIFDGDGKITYDMIPEDTYNSYGSKTYMDKYGSGSYGIASATSIEQCVKWPNLIYKKSTNGSWATDPNTNPWYHLPTSETPSRGQKTLFDPCPPGWCVPVYDAFKIAEKSSAYSSNTNGIYYGRTPNSTELNADRASFIICWNTNKTGGVSGMNKKRDMAILSMPIIKNNSYGLVNANFPMQVMISPDDGSFKLIDGTNEEAYLWTIDTNDKNNAYHSVIVQAISGAGNSVVNVGTAYNETLRPESGLYDVKYYAKWYKESAVAATGHAVRCIQEPK